MLALRAPGAYGWMVGTTAQGAVQGRQNDMTTKLLRIGSGAAALALVLLAANAGAEEAQQHAMPAGMSDEEMIKSALSAAPEAVAQDATVVAGGADGKMRVLLEGHNGFPCLPDNPASPGPDPMCGDANAMSWA